MKTAIGILGVSIADFYISEPKEIYLALEGYRNKQEDDFVLNQIAAYNAIGLHFSKGFKSHNPFKDKQDTSSPKSSSLEEKKETLEYLMNRFYKQEGEEK